MDVSTAAALKTAAGQPGNHIRLASGTYGTNGWLQLASNTTIESAHGAKAVIKGGLMVKGESNVIIRNLAVRPSDLEGNAGDMDALFFNGLQSPTGRILVSNVTAIWGPDIGGIAVLGDVNDVTVQCSILGEGVRYSEHHEGAPPDGHSMGLSVFQLDKNVDPADRLTFRYNLVTTSDRRMPVIHGARQVDWVNNASYNWGRNGPDGNPRSMNYIGNVIKMGPLSIREEVWRSRPHSANPCCYQGSVYLSDNLAVGFSYSEDLAPGVKRTSAFPLSVTPASSGTVTNFIAANAGPIIRDATDQRLIDNFLNGTGEYFNGQNYPAPNPTWAVK